MNKFNIGELKEWTKEERMPFILHWNITETCNLRCTHCCVPKRPQFVDLESALTTIDFLKKKGFFLITLSGGECLLHPNFKEIYMAIKRAGMYVNVFTNGTTLTPELKELFAEYQPRKVEVSVYGYDEKSFYETTGSKKGYDLFLDTLNFLKEHKIRTVVKAPITNKNCDHLKEFIELASKYDAEYKFGTFVFPRLDGDLEPLNERLPFEKAVSIEFTDDKARNGYCDRVRSKGCITEDFKIKCSACTNSYMLNPDNSFSFCGMMIEPKFTFGKEKSIEEAFAEVSNYRDDVIEMYNNGPCKKCKYGNVCPGCPAHLQLETGNIDTCNEYFLNITKEKLRYCGLNVEDY